MKASTIARYLAIGALAGTLSFPAFVSAQDGGSGETPKPEEKKAEEKKPEPKKPEGNPGGGDRGGDRGGRGGRGGRMGGGMLQVDTLKKELNLTDEQVGKVEALQDELREKFRSMMGGGGGGGDRGNFQEKMAEITKEIRDKIRGFLTDEQKPKFEEFTKKQDEQRGRMGGGPGGDRGGRGGFGGNPEQRKKQLIEDAEKALVLSAEEKTAILPLIEKAVEARFQARTDGDKRREEFLGFVKKDAPSEEVKAKLEAYRKARTEDEDKVKAAQKALRDVLTVEQEAKLCALNVLD